jgi:hypothetical protein
MLFFTSALLRCSQLIHTQSQKLLPFALDFSFQGWRERGFTFPSASRCTILNVKEPVSKKTAKLLLHNLTTSAYIFFHIFYETPNVYAVLKFSSAGSGFASHISYSVRIWFRSTKLALSRNRFHHSYSVLSFDGPSFEPGTFLAAANHTSNLIIPTPYQSYARPLKLSATSYPRPIAISATPPYLSCPYLRDPPAPLVLAAHHPYHSYAPPGTPCLSCASPVS